VLERGRIEKGRRREGGEVVSFLGEGRKGSLQDLPEGEVGEMIPGEES